MNQLIEVAAIQATLNFWIDQMTAALRAGNRERARTCGYRADETSTFLYDTIAAVAGVA